MTCLSMFVDKLAGTADDHHVVLLQLLLDTPAVVDCVRRLSVAINLDAITHDSFRHKSIRVRLRFPRIDAPETLRCRALWVLVSCSARKHGHVIDERRDLHCR